MRKVVRNLLTAGTGLVTVYGAMKALAKKGMEDKSIDDDNPYIKLDVHTEGRQSRKNSVYEGKIKPALDRIFSFGSLLVLSPLLVLISLAVYIDDPGPVFFTQKRIGKNKAYFMCHKFRSMKMSTPHDVPTHQLADPEQYITRVGRVLRRMSLDELPQIWDIWRGRMSIIGPRPALWNQEDLVTERSKWNANSVLPGLTGLAQIKGRDELFITNKAKLDGKYVRVLKAGGMKALLQDVLILLGTVSNVFKHNGVVEGGTGNLTSTMGGTEKEENIDLLSF